MNLTDYKKDDAQKTNKQLREDMLAKDPHCYWCKREVRPYEMQKRLLRRGERYPDDMATIDHLYDRFDKRRYIIYKDGAGKVLSCYKCNMNRSYERLRTLPKGFLLEREKLALERKQRGDKTPRPIIFEGLHEKWGIE